MFFFFSSRRRHTRCSRDWSSDVCSSDLLESQPAGDWRLHFSAGAVYAGCKLYDQAEASFSRAMDGDPRNFDILYNLGLAALHAGHTVRAASVFEVALNQRPQDADCLYALSQAYLQG